jgi:F-type H+-transporting ATPase subunit delta
MAARGVAKRYAQAVFELAREQQTTEQWLADLTRLAEAANDPVVGGFFSDPNQPVKVKLESIQKLLPDLKSQEALNLGRLLVTRRRFEILPELLEVYRDLLLESQGIAIAQVTTAVELTSAEQQDVRERLAKIVGRTIELRARVDPSIEGGLVARIGDQLIDGSVATQLRNLRATLAR